MTDKITVSIDVGVGERWVHRRHKRVARVLSVGAPRPDYAPHATGCVAYQYIDGTGRTLQRVQVPGAAFVINFRRPYPTERQ